MTIQENTEFSSIIFCFFSKKTYKLSLLIENHSNDYLMSLR